MGEAVGILEVFGLVCAFMAADAGCKAGNVWLEPFDKNKPANADSLPVPLLVTIKFRGDYISFLINNKPDNNTSLWSHLSLSDCRILYFFSKELY